MSKPLTWIILILFILVVPFGSWFYLKRGLDYRKDVLRELTPKDTIDLNDTLLAVFSKKTTLLILDEEKAADQTFINKVHEQYGQSKTFQIVSTLSDNNLVNIDPKLKDLFFNSYLDKAFVIMDTSGRIRNSYLNDETSISKMIEHLAIILPRPQEPDIKIKQ